VGLVHRETWDLYETRDLLYRRRPYSMFLYMSCIQQIDIQGHHCSCPLHVRTVPIIPSIFGYAHRLTTLSLTDLNLNLDPLDIAMFGSLSDLNFTQMRFTGPSEKIFESICTVLTKCPTIVCLSLRDTNLKCMLDEILDLFGVSPCLRFLCVYPIKLTQKPGRLFPFTRQLCRSTFRHPSTLVLRRLIPFMLGFLSDPVNYRWAEIRPHIETSPTSSVVCFPLLTIHLSKFHTVKSGMNS
jgi:hypothetical protein